MLGNLPMTVNLVNYSQHPPEAGGATLSVDKQMLNMVAYCARVSNPANQHNEKTAENLVRYLIKHKHWSPLEMVSMNLEVGTTRDIGRQILRHRSFSFQEFSQRYAKPSDMGEMFTMRECRMQDTKNRQNSIQCDDAETIAWWIDAQRQSIALATTLYTGAIDRGIAKEQARALLPEGLTKSRMYMNGTLRSWVHYIELRSANGTQQEHMDIARECATVISKVFPMVNEFVSD